MKLLAVDMDGTCLDSRNQIREETLVWLRRAKEQGVEIVPTTGRTLSCIPHQLKGEDLYRYVITSNGAVVTDIQTGETVFRALIPRQTALSLIDQCQGRGLGMTAHIGHEYLVQGRCLAALGRLQYGPDAVSSRTVRRLIPCVEQDVEELQFFFFTDGARQRTRQALAAEEGLESTYSGRYVEVYSKNATKGSALAAVAEHLHVAREDIACVGDGENDLTMFREAGLRFAMGNAVPQLKAQADRVVATNNENGVAQAIQILLAG